MWENQNRRQQQLQTMWEVHHKLKEFSNHLENNQTIC